MDIKQITENLGFESLNVMQEAMLSCKADNRILLAPTGAGKTLAYLLPTLCSVNPEREAVEVIIISPSRELALQIETVFRSTKSGVSVSCLYGGHSLHTEKRSLAYFPTFIVATPGRLLDHLEHNIIDGETVTHVIFDEFDKLLEMGFSDEVGAIMDRLPNIKQRILTSATSTLDYPDFITSYNFETLDFLTGKASGDLTVKKIYCEPSERLEKLVDLLKLVGNEPTIIFCNFREQSEEVSDYLYDLHIESEYFHGGMEQFDRERSLTKFRNHSVNILVSTDLAARGLDIPNIKHIIHYELPTSESAFVHRNGRTARVSESGCAYLMIPSHKEKKEGMEWLHNSEFETIDVVHTEAEVPLPEWVTIYIGKGRKDKLSKIDIVGFLCQKGDITKSDIGIIELKDNHSFVAVRWDLAKELIRRVRDEKIKNMKTKIVLSL